MKLRMQPRRGERHSEVPLGGNTTRRGSWIQITPSDNALDSYEQGSHGQFFYINSVKFRSSFKLQILYLNQVGHTFLK